MKILLLLALLFPFTASAATFPPVVTGSLTNRSITNLTTASLQVVAANASRKYLVIQNVNSVNIGCSIGTAAIGTSGTITLLPNASWTFEGNYVYTGAINCIGASGSNLVVVAYEGT